MGGKEWGLIEPLSSCPISAFLETPEASGGAQHQPWEGGGRKRRVRLDEASWQLMVSPGRQEVDVDGRLVSSGPVTGENSTVRGTRGGPPPAVEAGVCWECFGGPAALHQHCLYPGGTAGELLALGVRTPCGGAFVFSAWEEGCSTTLPARPHRSYWYVSAILLSSH